jgi:hypothetical protein
MYRGEEDEDEEDLSDEKDKNVGTQIDSSSDGDASGASFWADDKGNLKFVNLVVRNPCCIFCSLLFTCLALTVMLMVVLVQNGNPFSDPEAEGDLDDVRSIQFDSFRLAHEDIEDARDILAASQSTTVIPRQSETADFTYWVFESDTPAGVFGSESAIAAMKESFDLFMLHEDYDQYCLLKYPNLGSSDNSTVDAQPFCDTPLTPLTFYYAAEWDEAKVASVLEELKTPGNIEIFNQLALCYTRGLYCELIDQGSLDQADIAWALGLEADLSEITQHWDMSGELVPNITQATELAAYLKQIDVYKGLVDFGFDKGFGVDNLLSVYSRGVVLWGGPLETSSALASEEKEDQEDEDDEDRKE